MSTLSKKFPQGSIQNRSPSKQGSVHLYIKFVFCFQGAFRDDATRWKSGTHVNDKENGQEIFDTDHVRREHAGHVLVRNLHRRHQQGMVVIQRVRADGNILGGHVFRSHGRVDRALDPGQRDFSQRVSKT